VHIENSIMKPTKNLKGDVGGRGVKKVLWIRWTDQNMLHVMCMNIITNPFVQLIYANLLKLCKEVL
jgi:hypothetical protein